jgi:hypothetical protein
MPDNSTFCTSCGRPLAGASAGGASGSAGSPSAPPPSGPGGIPYFKNDPVIVLVLGIVTCGLYLIYWNIKASQVINGVVGREMISQPVAILSGCCMPVNLYFYYLCGQALPDLARATGNPAVQEKGTLLLILGFLVPMAAAMIIQGHINELYEPKAA